MQESHNINTGETKEIAREGISFEEASDVLNQSNYRLSDFWLFSGFSDLDADATMLRTVEWCKIGGFNDWWRRLAENVYEMTIKGGIDPIPASFYLFSVCRSDFAIELMSKTLVKLLEAIDLPEFRQVGW